MPRKTIGEYEFAMIYPMYLQKVEKKGRTKDELDTVTKWLTGYDDAGLADQIERKTTFAQFFEETPQLHPNVGEINGVVCGKRVEDIEDPLEQKVRWLDKLVDELARGKKLESILR
ncbi:DUF2200 domain-containing protein [Sphingomicrobium sediminis]|uniref:DUF2200 domain-containing protein n=1 Tax=Sphingomicrobium sediminis TaxID=2950949 RepID=A0A9X2J2C6_9SPHN|nr:DUF2200 domain-containing protein [Sphingomicrobium sediminis]MCM8557664.1 DUF2200 domain-containing protein [Sphingomicrobium sediminis]